MSVLHRATRNCSLVALLLLLCGVLVACRKPAPSITVFGDGTSVQVGAAFYQHPGGPVRQPVTDYAQATSITVRAGSELLVDVPRTVATNTWLVAAFTLDGKGNATPLDGAGTAQTVHGSHSTRLSTTPAGVGSYYLQVGELRNGQQSGGWLVRVRTTQ